MKLKYIRHFPNTFSIFVYVDDVYIGVFDAEDCNFRAQPILDELENREQIIEEVQDHITLLKVTRRLTA